jgi:hypothetical protein
MQIMKNRATSKTNQPLKSERIIHRGWIALLVVALGIAFLLSTSGFQTYWSKERRQIAAAGEIVTAIKVYRDASPGTAKEFPRALADLSHDPRMLADVSYLATLPVDPITLRQDYAWRGTKIIIWSACLVCRRIRRWY